MQPPDSLANDLCGAFRPGHFSGVATVVLKLFNLVQPHVAVFGKKDYQQLFVIRELVRQFNLPIDIVAGDTLREADGLAMSSRNGYLGASERIQAAALQRELAAVVATRSQAGERDVESLCTAAGRHLKMAGWRVDYVAVRDADTLQAPTADSTRLVVLGAAWLGEDAADRQPRNPPPLNHPRPPGAGLRVSVFKAFLYALAAECGRV